MSLFAHDDHSRRLNRAKLQYENLLLHAGEVLVDKDDTNASLLSATNASLLHPSHSPVHSKYRDTHLFQSPGLEQISVSHNFMNDSMYDENPLTDTDKDGIILSLQEEVDRLRNKLESVVSSVENVIQDAQIAQDEIKTEHDNQLHALMKKNARLEEENNQLKVSLELSEAELAVERDHLLKAARFIERLKRRGREYVDAQRKSAVLLHTNSALSTTTTSLPGGHSRGTKTSTAVRTHHANVVPSRTHIRSPSSEEDREAHSSSSHYNSSSGHERLIPHSNSTPGSGKKKATSTPGSGKKSVNFMQR